MPLAMWTLLLYLVPGLALGGLAVAFYAKRRRFDRRIATTVEALLTDSASVPPQDVRPDDAAALPPPVRDYFTHVLPHGRPPVHSLRLRQTGTFRAGDRSSPWSDFTATQHVTIQPPGFVWDAFIEMLPGVSVRVLDAYVQGQGRLQARLGGVVPVADATPGPALDEGELLRYLAEAPLYPTALLPSMGVVWTAVDDRSARATLTHQGTTASLLFHFNDRNEVARVTGKRPFLKDDGSTERRSWKGTWRNYEPRDGLRVPTEGEVAWLHPEGEEAYWRGQMETIEYQFADRETADARRPSNSS